MIFFKVCGNIELKDPLKNFLSFRTATLGSSGLKGFLVPHSYGMNFVFEFLLKRSFLRLLGHESVFFLRPLDPSIDKAYWLEAICIVRKDNKGLPRGTLTTKRTSHPNWMQHGAEQRNATVQRRRGGDEQGGGRASVNAALENAFQAPRPPWITGSRNNGDRP